ncbi:MAG: hypothetical protein ACM3XM_06565, partial [Mycobacterium leprae]
MARRIALQGGQVLTPAGELERYTLLLAGGRIEALLPAEGPVPADAALPTARSRSGSGALVVVARQAVTPPLLIYRLIAATAS